MPGVHWGGEDRRPGKGGSVIGAEWIRKNRAARGHCRGGLESGDVSGRLAYATADADKSNERSPAEWPRRR